jgi:hypothetical protein
VVVVAAVVGAVVAAVVPAGCALDGLVPGLVLVDFEAHADIPTAMVRPSTTPRSFFRPVSRPVAIRVPFPVTRPTPSLLVPTGEVAEKIADVGGPSVASDLAAVDVQDLTGNERR